MQTNPRGPALALLLTGVSLAGCLGGAGSAPEAGEEPPPSGSDEPRVWWLNETLPVDPGRVEIPQLSVEGALTHVLVASHDAPPTVRDNVPPNPGTPVYVARADLATGQWQVAEVAPPEFDLGQVHAAGAGNDTWVAVEIQQRAPDGRVVDTWINWILHKDDDWTVESKPDRWHRHDLLAMTSLGDTVYVLAGFGLQKTLWSQSGGVWRQEVLPQFGSVSRPALASNGTHLFIAGDDANGNVILLERPAGGTVFTSTVLQLVQGIQASFMEMAAAPGLPPVPVWLRSTVTVQKPNGDMHLFAAHQRDGVWGVEEIRRAERPDLGVYGIASSTTADYFTTGGNQRETLWRRNEAGWAECDLGNEFWPNDSGLVTNGSVVLLTYTAYEESAFPRDQILAVELDPSTPSCLPAGIGPLRTHP